MRAGHRGTMATSFFSMAASPSLFLYFGRLFYQQNGAGESLGRWVPTSRFEHSNRQVLALDICLDMVVSVVHGGPCGS